MTEPLILALDCADKPGITARVTGFLYERGCNVLEAQQFNDQATDRFFMRVAFDPGSSSRDQLRSELAALASEYNMTGKLALQNRPRRVLIMVSKFDHCLVDLLYRWRIGELNIDPVAIVSNHPREAAIQIDIGDIPFHHVPVKKDTKPEAEARVRAHFAGRCINIHHSFLPGFKGAKPYHQAHARGVKMIGATAHFVTSDLDEGPIIHQDVEAITHADTPEELVRKGRDIERRVLAEAVRLFAEERVAIAGSRTVVFKG